MSGQLVITRSADGADSLRRYRIFVDDALVGRLNPGDELALGLPMGEHDIVAWVDWCRSDIIRVNIQENHVTELEVGVNKSAPGFLSMLHQHTIGRTSYLYLRERQRRVSVKHAPAPESAPAPGPAPESSAV